MIVLGGGVCKHQIANAMLIVSYRQLYTNVSLELTLFQRNGADYSVYIVIIFKFLFEVSFTVIFEEHWPRI